MKKIRDAREYVANNFTTEFPLTEARFKTEGMNVLMDLWETEKLSPTERGKIIVANKGGQLAWSTLMVDIFAEFDYEYELAMRWHPAGRLSSVIIDPRVSFGAPVVGGLPTWVVRGRWMAHESIEEIMADFDVTRQSVQDALDFEGIKFRQEAVEQTA